MVSKDKQNNRRSTDLLRCIAIFLIANSHLDNLYPIPQLGTGGAIGNALFFMLSGYGLALSEKLRAESFFAWYRRRIVRIYPSLILAVAFLIILREEAWRYWGIRNYVENLIWPTPYWFISALMLFYIFFFIISRHNKPKYYFAGIMALAIPYGYFYMTVVDLSSYSIEGPGYIKWIFYLQIMLFGGYLANSVKGLKGCMITDSLLLMICIALYYGILLLVSRGHVAQFQAVTQLLMFPIMLLFLKVSRADFIVNNVINAKYACAALSLIAGLTLEIYLLHGIVYSNSFIQSTIFPLNIAVFWIAVISISYALNRTTRFLTRKYSGTFL